MLSIQAHASSAALAPGLDSVIDSSLVRNLLYSQVLEKIIVEKNLGCVFQPIVDFERICIHGYEGLIRGPQDSPLHAPVNLFRAAESAGALSRLDNVCQEVVQRSFATSGLPGFLFLNVIPSSLIAGKPLGAARIPLVDPRRIVIEITEIERIHDSGSMNEYIEFLRSQGYQFGIDDLGEGFANFRLWSEIRPEAVKIDKHFIRGLRDDPLKQEFVRSILRIGECANCMVIAEGIETLEDFDAVRALGVRYGQGFFLALPTAMPSHKLDSELARRLTVDPEPAFESIADASESIVLVHPDASRKASALALALAPIAPEVSNEAVANLFLRDENLHLIPVVSGGVPVGLIERHSFVNNFSRPYARELFGRKACRMFMRTGVPAFDHQESILNIVDRVNLFTGNQLLFGVFITRGGRYCGVVPGRDLVLVVNSMQLETARYANPLTMLPGNVPITKRIEEWLFAGHDFAAVYADLDHFKPFNDVFGYKKGDDLIQAFGRLLIDCAHPTADFVGHIGGDDFLILLRSIDWVSRCEQILALYPERVGNCIPPEANAGSGYRAEDRHGQIINYELPTVSLGAVFIVAQDYDNPLQVSSVAAEAKKQAKKMAGNSLFVERRN